MDNKIWLILSLVILLLIVALAVFFLGNKKKSVDYYALFISGIAWIFAGVPLKNYGLSVLGIVFLVIGLKHKDQWRTNRHSWDKMNKKEKIVKLVVLLALVSLVLYSAFR